MKAAFTTMCPGCNRLIHPGDPIAPTPDAFVWAHEQCAASSDVGGLAGPDEGLCGRCGLIKRAHLLDGGLCEDCRG